MKQLFIRILLSLIIIHNCSYALPEEKLKDYKKFVEKLHQTIEKHPIDIETHDFANEPVSQKYVDLSLFNEHLISHDEPRYHHLELKNHSGIYTLLSHDQIEQTIKEVEHYLYEHNQKIHFKELLYNLILFP